MPLYECQYPLTWCDLKCPRQQTRLAKDCECGGAQREWEHWKEISAKQED